MLMFHLGLCCFVLVLHFGWGAYPRHSRMGTGIQEEDAGGQEVGPACTFIVICVVVILRKECCSTAHWFRQISQIFDLYA